MWFHKTPEELKRVEDQLKHALGEFLLHQKHLETEVERRREYIHTGKEVKEGLVTRSDAVVEETKDQVNAGVQDTRSTLGQEISLEEEIIHDDEHLLQALVQLEEEGKEESVSPDRLQELLDTVSTYLKKTEREELVELQFIRRLGEFIEFLTQNCKQVPEEKTTVFEELIAQAISTHQWALKNRESTLHMEKQLETFLEKGRTLLTSPNKLSTLAHEAIPLVKELVDTEKSSIIRMESLEKIMDFWTQQVFTKD